jgi:hypothetical protein
MRLVPWTVRLDRRRFPQKALVHTTGSAPERTVVAETLSL